MSKNNSRNSETGEEEEVATFTYDTNGNMIGKKVHEPSKTSEELRQERQKKMHDIALEANRGKNELDPLAKDISQAKKKKETLSYKRDVLMLKVDKTKEAWDKARKGNDSDVKIRTNREFEDAKSELNATLREIENVDSDLNKMKSKFRKENDKVLEEE